MTFQVLVLPLLDKGFSAFLIRLLLFEQVVDNHQDAMGQGHNGFLAAHAFAESLVERPQIGAFTHAMRNELYVSSEVARERL